MSVTFDHDFEQRLRNDLRADADRAPTGWRNWTGTSTSVIERRRPRRNGRLASAIAIAATAAAGIVAVAVHQDGSGVEPVTSTPVPSGTEFPLVDGGPATSTGMGAPSVSELTRVLRVDGQPDFVASTALLYLNGRQPVEMNCLSQQGGGGGCSPVPWTGSAVVGITSSVDNRIAEYDVWTWTNVPADAAYVTYDDGDQHLWQRPIAGTVLFPNVPGSDEVVVAHGSDGAVLEQAHSATDGGPDPQLAEMGDPTQEQAATLSALSASTMRACLISAGGAMPGDGDVASFAGGIDQAAVWSTCASETKATVGAAVSALDITFHEVGGEAGG